uniref:VPS8 subunit of CORVET complex n=1 Tax=Cyprinodon variegatus TaxID=28743 RepID=A0A3Q2DZ58_CYPVA
MSQSPDSRSLLSASSQLNLMEVESIDDKEFDIPQVDTPPTLESILSQEEEEPFVLEDTCILNTDNMDAQSCDTSSLASSDSGDPAHLKRKRRPLDQSAAVHGSVLRLSLLKGISAQMVAASDKVDAGLPTAIAMSGVIAVGTSHGLALVFDTNQALRLCLGSKTTGAEFGAVSALSINHDCSRLLCGFAKGQITMWDLANGKLLRTITDAHPPGTAILHHILQDPVYGRGKLAEIQGLILGMLDTFTYEQTLLETTTSLLNHDLHWSLAHLRSVVTRGLHPRQDCCNICLQHYKRKQDATEEIVVFSCGHLYHLQCLQQKDCGRGQSSELPQPWRCYKCSSSHGGRGGASVEPSRSRSASLAQVGASPLIRRQMTLDVQQELSWDQLRGLYRGPSRLSILSEVSHGQGGERPGFLVPAQSGAENFHLKLAPPPLFEE